MAYICKAEKMSILCSYLIRLIVVLIKTNYNNYSINKSVLITRDGTKPIPNTRSIGYRLNFKVSVSPKNPIPIPSTFRYYFDTFSILYNHGYFNIKLQ